MIINKIDLAPDVGASLEVMQRDAAIMRPVKLLLFTNLKDETGLAEVIVWKAELAVPARDRRSLIDFYSNYQPEAHSHDHPHSHAELF